MTDTDDLDETPAEANSRRANTGAAVLAHYFTLDRTDIDGMVESLEEDHGPIRSDATALRELLTDLFADLLHFAQDPEIAKHALRLAIDHHTTEIELAKEPAP